MRCCKSHANSKHTALTNWCVSEYWFFFPPPSMWLSALIVAIDECNNAHQGNDSKATTYMTGGTWGRSGCNPIPSHLKLSSWVKCVMRQKLRKLCVGLKLEQLT